MNYFFRTNQGKSQEEKFFNNSSEATDYAVKLVSKSTENEFSTITLLDEKGSLEAVVEKDQHNEINIFY